MSDWKKHKRAVSRNESEPLENDETPEYARLADEFFRYLEKTENWLLKQYWHKVTIDYGGLIKHAGTKGIHPCELEVAEQNRYIYIGVYPLGDITIPKFLEGEELPEGCFDYPNPYAPPPETDYKFIEMLKYARENGKKFSDITKEEAAMFLVEKNDDGEYTSTGTKPIQNTKEEDVIRSETELMTDSLAGILRDETDMDQAREEALKEKYERRIFKSRSSIRNKE